MTSETMSDAPDKSNTSNTSPTPKPADNKPPTALDMTEAEYAAARLALTKTKPHNFLGLNKK